MGKVMLILDEQPKKCEDCPVCHTKDYEESCWGRGEARKIDTDKVPEWCPLKPAPEYRGYSDKWEEDMKNRGYNECVDRILR